tara:strand:+ start:111 stop:335 length:225 start_codon:yes stop_codon:yes gene_type:complete
MKTEKIYTHKQVSNIVNIFRDDNKKLTEFKDDIKQMIRNYISSDTSDENVYKVLEKLCINHMLEQNDKIEEKQL